MNVSERRVVLALALFIVAIVCYTAWRVTLPPRGEPKISETYLLDRNIQEHSDTVWQHAQTLSYEGRHKEAAFIFMDLAGMQNILTGNGSDNTEGQRKVTTQPSPTELFALFECTQAGTELRSLYAKLLANKYPLWKIAGW